MATQQQSPPLDFFSAAAPHHPISPSTPIRPDPFAEAIGRRFSAVPPVVSARLLPSIGSSNNSSHPQPPAIPIRTRPITAYDPPKPIHGLATHSTAISTPLSHMTLNTPPITPSPPLPISPLASAHQRQFLVPASSLSRFLPVLPSSLSTWLRQSKVLILDIRPNAAFATSRVPGSLSVSVPSTLLKRPAFSLDKLSTMLPTDSCRAQFCTWKTADRILVYDADTSALLEGSNILGLLRKFERENFQGDIAWIRGGFSAVWRDARNLIEEGDSVPSFTTQSGANSLSDGAPFLKASELPQDAFMRQSTTASVGRRLLAPRLDPAVFQSEPGSIFSRPVAVNPFYDNIRQLQELSQGITERIPLRLSESVMKRKEDLPFEWLKDLVTGVASPDNHVDSDTLAEKLATQFYNIELGEQKRLLGIMEHHCNEGSNVSSSSITNPTAEAILSENAPSAFPYSITAGFERGTKNRYKDIWPFEHARVRLKSRCLDDDSDYVNASYVQPICTGRRYIATQGPLPTTFNDFWTLCWEQDVHVIAMLTKQMEGTTVKCGNYWNDRVYGPLRLRLISSEGGNDDVPVMAGSAGFDFGLPRISTAASGTVPIENALIKRKFALSHAKYSNQPARVITQLQYLDWPDLGVPDSPKGLLALIREVDRAVAASKASPLGSAAATDKSPVLLHCSAGVGRTGAFAVVDAILDGIRHEMQLVEQAKALQKIQVDDVAPHLSRDEDRDAHMDVDEASTIPSSMNNIHSSSTQSSPITVRRLPSSASSPTTPFPFPRSSPHNVTSRSGAGGGFFDANLRLSPSLHTSPHLPPSFSSSFPEHSSSRFSFSNSNGLASDTRDTNHTSISPAPAPFVPGARPSLAHGGNYPDRMFAIKTSDSASPSGSSSYSPSTTENFSSSTNVSSFEASVPTSPTGLKRPRLLHRSETLPLLSSFPQPIRHVLEDMREQRMSLCQSLRQYVFVHRAIVEGALDLVDEQRARAATKSSHIASNGSRSRTNSAEKRAASPTELRKEYFNGHAKLTKRPSVKRKDRSDSSIETAPMKDRAPWPNGR